MKDIDSAGMRVRPLCFSKVYFNVPGGDGILFNYKLIKLVEDIGRTYGTVKGSLLKKVFIISIGIQVLHPKER